MPGAAGQCGAVPALIDVGPKSFYKSWRCGRADNEAVRFTLHCDRRNIDHVVRAHPIGVNVNVDFDHARAQRSRRGGDLASMGFADRRGPRRDEVEHYGNPNRMPALE
jgi:hypothetical protein